jgi:chromosomal replication initiator protein
MVVEIRQPDTATRIQIIRALAARRGMPLMDSVIELLAQRCRGSVRELEGTLTKLQALASLGSIRSLASASATSGTANAPARVEIGHALLHKLFETEGQNPSHHAVTSENIMDSIVERLNVTRSLVLGTSKQAHAVLARSMFAYLARQITSMSYPEIAAALGKKNHSTVITAAQRIQKQIDAKQEVTLPGSLEVVTLYELAEQLKHAARRA